MPYSAPDSAASMSASAHTIDGDFPPSSSVTRFIVCAALAAIALPVVVLPVNAILSTSGCATIAAPSSRVEPVTTLKTPGGKPASSAISASLSAVSGVDGAGLRTIVQPVASAGATFHEARSGGKSMG